MPVRESKSSPLISLFLLHASLFEARFNSTYSGQIVHIKTTIDTQMPVLFGKVLLEIKEQVHTLLA